MAVSLSALDTASNERGSRPSFKEHFRTFFLQKKLSNSALNTIASGGTMKMFFPRRLWPRSSRIHVPKSQLITERDNGVQKLLLLLLYFYTFLRWTSAHCKKWSRHYAQYCPSTRNDVCQMMDMFMFWDLWLICVVTLPLCMWWITHILKVCRLNFISF